jgi:hypothetical protein
MDSQPLVSLILCVKNGMPYLPEALASVRAQTYRHFELVVQDGGSTDGTLAVLDSLAGIPGIHVLSEPDGGVGDAYRRALDRCRGEIVGSIDADNLLEPDALAHVVDAFVAHPDGAAIYGSNRMIDTESAAVSVFVPGDFDLVRLVCCDLVPPFATAFFGRAACGAALRFEPTLRTCADFDLWLRLGHLPIRRIEPVLASTRLSNRSMTRRAETYEQFCRDKLAALAAYFAAERQSPLLAALHRHAVAGVYTWAAESVLDLEGPSERFHGFCEQASAVWPGSERLARVVEHVAPAPDPAPEVEPVADPQPDAAVLQARLARMSGRGAPLSDEELRTTARVLTAVLSAPDPTNVFRTAKIPAAVGALLTVFLARAWATGQTPLAEELERVYGILSLRAAAPIL